MSDDQGEPVKPKRVRLNTLFDIQSHMHVLSGARLKLAHKTKPFVDEHGVKHVSPYFVFWTPPAQKSISAYSIFDQEEAAREAYERLKDGSAPPKTRRFLHDYQEDQVIDFNNTVSRGSAKYTLPQMQKLTRQITEEFRMVATKIDYEPPNKDDPFWGLADTDLNEVLMKTRKLSIVLHELGHIVDTQIFGNDWVDHSPSFMLAYILLLERYMHFPRLTLEEMAKKHDLDVAKKQDIPAASPLMHHLLGA